MPLSVFHSLTATTPDNTSYEIRPQAHWNAPHVVSASLVGSEVIGAFSNSNGVSFGTAPSGAITASVSASSLIFSNSNGVSFGLNNGTITASISSATNALTNVNFSAGTTSTNGSALVFSNANSLSFGLAGNTLTGSFNASSLSFSNANNVSFGVNGATLTASASFPAATSVTYSNSNNVTFGVAAGVVTASASQSYQTQGQQGVSLAGNTSGTLTNITSGTMLLAGGNNVTLSQIGNAITISGPNTSAQQTGISGISAGTTVATNGTIIFSNANGVSFGVAGNTLTASVSLVGAVQTGISGIAVAGTNFTSGTVTFSNSNGISFGSAGAGIITASYTVPTQSNDTAAIYASSNTYGQAFSSTYDIRSLTMVGSGEISLGWSNGSLLISTPIGNFDSMGVSNLGNTSGTTGMLSQQAVLVGGNNITLSQATGANGLGTITISGPSAQTAISGVVAGTQTLTSGTVSFANSNGISFGLSNSSITASYTVPSTAGLLSAINISAGTTQSNFSNLVFSNANAVSFGINGNVITASIPSIAGAQTGISGIAVSNTTFTSGSVTFSNANGASFGGGGAGVITMSYTVPIISNLLSNIVISAGTASTVLSAFTFSNSNNVSFGYSAGSITASASFADSQTAISGIIAGNTTFTSGTVSLVNANGISFGSSGANGISASYTVPTQSTQPVAISGSNGSFAFSTLSMGNSNGLSFYTTNGSIVASYTVPGAVGGVGISAGTQSVSTGTVAFSNSNGISFGMSGSSVITASYTVPTQSAQPVAVSGSNGSFAFSTLTLGNLNGLSFYSTNGSMVGSYSQSTLTTNGLLSAFNVSAGTTQTNLSNLVFSNANSMSFGLNGSTITGSFSQSIQTQGQDYITIAGNTSGAGVLISSGTLVLVGGNNITISQNGNSLTLSGANVGGAQTGISGVVAGSQTQTAGTLQFSNSNGVSFGMSNSSVITASFSTAPQSVQSIGIYATGNTTLTSSGTVDARTLAFSGSGLITVGYSNGTVVIGDSGSQSNQTLGFTAVGNQTLSTTGTFDARSMYVSGGGNITAGFSNSSIIVSGSQTPMLVGFNTLGNDTGATGFVSNQVQLVGGNNITLSGSLNANSMTITISGGGGIGAAAGTQTQLSGTLSFSNANGINWGLNGSSILTASYTVPTQSVQPVGISDSNGYTSFGSLLLGALNGMTLYGSNSSLVGSYTTAPNPVISAGTQVGNSTGTILFGNANGISFGMSNSSVITASYAQSLQPNYVYAISQTVGQSSSSSFGSSLSIVGAGNISVGWSNSSLLISGAGGTAGGGGNLGIYVVGTNTTGTTSGTYPASSIPIIGAGIISIGNSAGSLYISAPNTTSYPLLSAGISNLGNFTGLTGAVGNQLIFVGGNNVTLSGSTNSAGSATITINAAAGGGTGGASSVGAYAIGNTTQNTSATLPLSALSFNGLGAMSVGISSGSIQLSAPSLSSLIGFGLISVSTTGSTISIIDSGPTFSAGSAAAIASNIVFSNSNNVSFGLANGTGGVTITASASGGGGGGGNFSAGVSGGNTSGTTGVNGTQVVFAGGNNITLSQVTNTAGATITISGANAGGAQTGISQIIAGTQTLTAGTLSFANSNGISFGLSNSSILTASYTSPSTAGLISAINLSAGTTSGNISAVVLSNSNGMSFGLNGSTITGSYTVPSTAGLISAVNVSAGTTSNNLSAAVYSNSNNVSFGLNGSTITASASFAQTTQTQASGNIAGTGFTSAGANISLSGTLSTNGLSLSASVAAQSVQPVAVSGSNGSFAFSTLTMGNLNGLSHYTSNGSLVASYTVPSTAGLVSAINLSAGTTSTNASAFTFSNSNGVSFGINGGTITASVAAGGGAFSAGVSGGNTSGNTGATGTQVVFAGGNNITLSQSTNANGATITISGANIGGAQTGISGIFAGTQTQSSGTLSFANSNGISFGLSNSSVLTASYTVPTQSTQPVAVSGSNGSFAFSTLTLGNLNGASFYSSNGSIVASYTVPSTAGLLSAVNVSAGTTSNNLSAVVYSNSNGVSFGLNGSTVTASVAAQTVQTQNLVDVSLSGNTSGALALVSSGTLILAGGNNITLSQNGQSITISGPNVGGAQTGISGLVVSNTTYTSGTVTFQNANGISFGSSGANGISASYTVPSTAGLLSGINFSAGTTTTNGSGFTFSNSNNVSFGLNAGTITASASFAQSTQTQASGAIAGTGFTSAGANVSLSGTLATNGLSLSASVAAQSVQPVAVSGSNGSFAFSTLTMGNLNGLTHYTSNGSLVASYTVPSTAGLISAINASAGTTSNNLSAVVYSNSNNVSFGLNGSTITASASFAQTVQTQNLIDVSLSGNTSGALALVSSGTLILAGGNNITLSQNGQSITISGPNVGGAQTGISGIVVSNTTYTSGTVTFQNANGISFGSSGANGISASYTVPSTAGLISAVNFSAGTTSGNIASVVYSNSNNVSFGLNGSTITASASFAQSVQTQASGNIAGTGFTSAGANVSLSGTLNTAGLSLSASVAAPITTAAYYFQGNTTGQSSSSTSPDQTLSISAAGIISGGWSNGTFILSATAPSTAGLLSAVNLSAGTTSNNVSNWVYSNSNGVSFGLNGSTVTASILPNIVLSAGTTNVQNSGTIVFSNSNGVSFGVNGQTITASVAAASDNFNIVSMGTSTFGGATGGATFSASNGTIGLYAGSNITISQTSNSIIFYGTSGGGGGGATSGSFFAAGNSTNNSSTTLALTSQVFQGNGALSVGFSNGSIQLSAPATSSLVGAQLVSVSTVGSTISIIGSGPIISAGTTSSNLSAITFSNSNGVSFGLNNGVITASAQIVPLSYFEPPVRGQVGTIQLSQPAMYFQPFNVNENIAMYRMQMLASVSTQSVSTLPISASVSAGNASSGSGSGGTSGTVVLFSRQGTGTINPNSNVLLSFYSNTYSMSLGESISVSWSTNASSATASYTRSGAFGYIANINSTGGVTTSSNTTSASGSFSATSTNANSFSTQSTFTFGSLMMSNMRPIIVPFNSSLTPGEYWLGHQQSTNTGSTNMSGLANVVRVPQGMVYFTTNNQGYIEYGQTVSNASSNIQQGWGSLTNTGVSTTTFALANVLGGAAQSPQQLWFNMAAAIK